jgi:pimeloyl-ACP methyl ester carboxylesterase
MTRIVRLGVILTLTVSSGVPFRAHAETESLQLKPCRVAGIKNEVQCGVIQRPLNPAEPGGKKIDVHFVVVPAVARNKQPDALFMFAGGPGQSAIRVGPQTLGLFSRFNTRRDIVFIDQRGTGKSAPLDCQFGDNNIAMREAIDMSALPKRLQDCREQLQKLPHGDLRYYTTTIAMQDADAVRAALGYPKINLVGGSYGTRAVLEYMRQFPGNVRRAVIDGVAPPDMVLPASFSIDNQAALDALLSSCEKDSVCSRQYPQLRSKWQVLMASLPRAATVAHPVTGRSEEVTLTRDVIAGAVRSPLYVPPLASALPHAIAEASDGRFTPILGLANAFSSNSALGLAWGMHYSVVCAEDYPRMQGGKIDAPGADFGTAFMDIYRRVCAQWPRGEVPKDFYTMPAAKQPVLIFSGGIDPATPPRHGERALKALGANARHYVVPNAGHGVMAIGCVRDVMFRFLDAKEDAAALAVDAACVQNIPRPFVYLPPGTAQTAQAAGEKK